MPPKCQVASLIDLSLYHVVRQIAFALSDDDCQFYQEIQEYFQYSPPEIVEDILREILSNESLDAGTRFTCLEVLLKNNIKKLETGMFPQFYYNRILEIIGIQGNGLHHLNLKGVWIKDNPKLLCSTIKKLEYLKVLHIPHIADDEVLHVIANLQNLKVLNVSGECLFSKEGLNSFCQLLKTKKSYLNVLDIGSYGEENIFHETIGDILVTLPQLVTLSSYSYVGKSLNYIYNKDKKFICNLKYVHDTKSTKEICETIYKTCPNLEELYFDSPENDVIESIEKFQSLYSLKLNRFQCLDLHKLLRKWGTSLHTVSACLGRGIFNISKLAIACPNLTKLEFYKMEFISHTTEEYLPKLNHLEVTYSELTPSCLRYILSKSPNLKVISIGDEVGITDGDLYRLCADFCLLNLEKVWFNSARYLTINAIELLMSHCPELRVLGKVTGWTVTSEDIYFMKAVIQSTNSDLTLLPEDLFF